MKKYSKIIIFILIILLGCLVFPELLQASSLTPPTGSSGSGTALTAQAGTLGVNNLIGTIIKAILGVIGAFALLMFVYGGFTMLSSGGLQERIEQGKKTLIWSTLGLILVIFSYVIVDFIILALTS